MSTDSRGGGKKLIFFVYTQHMFGVKKMSDEKWCEDELLNSIISTHEIYQPIRDSREAARQRDSNRLDECLLKCFPLLERVISIIKMFELILFDNHTNTQVSEQQIECFRVALKYSSVPRFTRLEIFRRGMLPVIKVLLECNLSNEDVQETIEDVIAFGHIDTVKLLHTKMGIVFNENSIFSAVIHNQAETLEYILTHSKQSFLLEYHVEDIAEHNWLEGLKIVHKCFPEVLKDTKVLVYCVQNQSFECFEYCIECYPEHMDTWFTGCNEQHISMGMIKKIDMDKCVWRKLLNYKKYPLLANPMLQQLVTDKMDSLDEQQIQCDRLLSYRVAEDIVDYCVIPYI